MLILACLFVLIALTLVSELYIVKPKTIFEDRKFSGLFIHTLAILFVFIAIFFVFHRVIFSSCIAFVIHLIVVIINNAKYQALKESLVFSDIMMFSQAFKFPRFYFPFVNSLLLITVPIVVILVLYLDLTLEPAIYLITGLSDSVLFLICNFILFILQYYLAKKQILSFEPKEDLKKFGLFSSVIIGTVQAYQAFNLKKLSEKLINTPFSLLLDVNTAKGRADIIVVQSESFFDVRRLYAAISPEILKNYDATKATAQFSGKLNVPAWGANTMRTEFAFLSGLNDDELNCFRYYPYHYIHSEVFSIAAYLKKQGFRTVCIHPFSADFFERKRVFPLLGFDEFIDINQFKKVESIEIYISDFTVTKKIIEIQESSDKPVFILAITIENHGPFHLESISVSDEKMLYQIKPDFNSDDLTAYLRHLKNADAMIADLTTHFQQKTTPTYFCFYGDHVPSISSAYQALQFENRQSDYFIWRSHHQNAICETKTIAAHQLGVLLSTTALAVGG
jgi:phosphoglycerol transferase MdoB-like AlkP superfamily enzyme